ACGAAGPAFPSEGSVWLYAGNRRDIPCHCHRFWLSCIAPTPAPGCLAASGRQSRLPQAAPGPPASPRRPPWPGFGPPPQPAD
ncbi:hypothetical protein J4V21_09190, partial [Escherichia coli]